MVYGSRYIGVECGSRYIGGIGVIIVWYNGSIWYWDYMVVCVLVVLVGSLSVGFIVWFMCWFILLSSYSFVILIQFLSCYISFYYLKLLCCICMYWVTFYWDFCFFFSYYCFVLFIITLIEIFIYVWILY